MALDGINFLKYNEFMIGDSHSSLTDTLNRPLKELIELFGTGQADTQVTRNHIKINSGTEVEASVVTDDIVYWDEVSNKWIKAYLEADGIIDVEKGIVYIFGLYEFQSIDTLVPGTKYYLDLDIPGAITDDPFSGVLVGRAFTTTKILNVCTGGEGSGSGGNTISEGMVTHTNTISHNLTVRSANNTISAGPIIVEDGYTVTVEDGANWVIV